MATKPNRFKLKKEDRALLKAMERDELLSARKWLRIRVLWMLDKEYNVAKIAEGLGTFPRVIRRVRDEFLRGGIDAALTDKPKGNRLKRKLDDGQAAKIVSLACSAAPKGFAQWTLSMLAEEATKRRVAPNVTRDDVFRILKEHDLKPWREKNVVRTEIRRRVRGPNGKRVAVVLGYIEENAPAGVPR
jgi:hypothetical protein